MTTKSLGAIVAPAPVKSTFPSASPANPNIISTPASPSMNDDIARKVAEAKRRVADAQSKLAIKDNPYMVRVLSNLVLLRIFNSIQPQKSYPVDAANGKEESTPRTGTARGRPQNGCSSTSIRQRTYSTAV